jgi:VIT1/CCC1 family predicted Fe2+/Mn2+ transporter
MSIIGLTAMGRGNDGVLSTASLVLVSRFGTRAHNSVIVAGVVDLIAGAMSMGAGEYVPVHFSTGAESQ